MNHILTFDPWYSHVIWGGDRIAKFKGIAPLGEDVGESWELSAIAGHESIVNDGPLKGRGFGSLVAEFGPDIMSERLYNKYKGVFPLLIKFIDSRRDLSIQVHPDDTMAARFGKNGKTEMWYSIDPAPGAYLYAGFNQPVSASAMRKYIENSTIVDTLNKYYTKPGDVFFLPAGCVHAIGTGNFVAEIQQSSDITYRIFDYNRRGADGKPRELHVDLALEATKYDGSALPGISHVDVAPGQEAPLVECPFFDTDIFAIAPGEKRTIDLVSRDSFTILICTAGTAVIKAPDGSETVLRRGHTALVPATVPSITLCGEATVISVFEP